VTDEGEKLVTPSVRTMRGFVAAIMNRTPNGEWIPVQFHPNGDWSVGNRERAPIPADDPVTRVAKAISDARWERACKALGTSDYVRYEENWPMLIPEAEAVIEGRCATASDNRDEAYTPSPSTGIDGRPQR
jgi:hypothetical protein